MKKLFEEFDVAAYPADEKYKGETPEDTVSTIASRKLAAVTASEAYDLVVASDALVYMDGKYYGKPSDEAEAVRMLTELSGRTHTVYSAVAVRYKGKTYKATDATRVVFRNLTQDEIQSYVSGHNCLDKAGAYAVQDGVTVASYEGSYDNVVGLPTEKLRSLINGLITEN